MATATATPTFAEQLSAYYQRTFPAVCNISSAPCADEPCKRAIVAGHEIFKGQFIRMTNPVGGSGTKLSSLQILKNLNKGACSTHFMEIHKDIRMYAVQNHDPSLAYYSYSLFEGILLDDPVSFTFFNALTREKKEDIIFSVQFQSQPERYFSNGDVLNLVPAISLARPASPPLSCQDDDYRRGVAIAHNIREDVFLKYLANFWEETPVPTPYIVTWSNLELFLKDGDCSTQRVLLNWDSDKDDNMINDFGFGGATEANKQNWNKEVLTPEGTFYSIELFYGIRLLKDAMELRFYKGKNEYSDMTLLIEAICADGTHQYYDLSNDRP